MNSTDDFFYHKIQNRKLIAGLFYDIKIVFPGSTDTPGGVHRMGRPMCCDGDNALQG